MNHMHAVADHDARVGRNLRAMVVDDEPDLAGLVASYLEREGFEVTVTGDGAQAVHLAREVDPDVMILDLGLPGLDGVEVCRRLREFSDAYVVMLTARTDEVDTLIGLSVGADDYMSKPFSPRELTARVQARIRRPRAGLGGPGAVRTDRGVRVFGDLTVDIAAHEVTVSGVPVHLTRTEFDVLATLSADPGVVVTRRALIETVWRTGWDGADHLVDVHIGHLRRKLGDDAARGRYVMTIRGVGYRMGAGR
ncbi:response regulator transcription factor [Gordonia sp. HY442]|nr:response regulator transcription factor [Gordonia zhenghanii]MCF8606978.1 response regulator transcription factor [Gordonia zhenghanii]